MKGLSYWKYPGKYEEPKKKEGRRISHATELTIILFLLFFFLVLVAALWNGGSVPEKWFPTEPHFHP